MLDLDSEEGRRQFYENIVRGSYEGIRPKSLRRLVILHELVAYEIEEFQGPAYSRFREVDTVSRTSRANFIAHMDVEMFYTLREAASQLLEEHELDYVFDVSGRTAQDYVKSLQMLYLWQ